MLSFASLCVAPSGNQALFRSASSEAARRTNVTGAVPGIKHGRDALQQARTEISALASASGLLQERHELAMDGLVAAGDGACRQGVGNAVRIGHEAARLAH